MLQFELRLGSRRKIPVSFPDGRQFGHSHGLSSCMILSAMHQRTMHLTTLVLICISAPCFAQTGTVTFYSLGLSPMQQLKDTVVPVGTAPFTGWLFDGDQKMVHVQGGRFISFELALGIHKFTVPYDSSAPGKTALNLTVEAAGHYCVRLSAKYVSGSLLVPAVYFVDSRIEQVSCQQAVKEAGLYKPIKVKRVDPTVRGKLQSSVSFPRDN